MKTIVYVEINEEITSIYNRIRSLKADQIYLVVPKKAMLFQSAVNLNILKTKLQEVGKRLILVTTDRTGQHLGKKAGLPVHDRVEIKTRTVQEEASPQIRNQPIKARRNEVVREAPRRSTEKKVTLKELIHDLRSRAIEKKQSLQEAPYAFLRPGRKFLLLILSISVGLFLLISYLALAGATLYISPQFEYVDHTANIILADKRKNQRLLREYKKNVIPSEAIQVVLKQTKVFQVISKEFQGRSAKGEIRIINISAQEWPLKAGTRFQVDPERSDAAEEGLIFKIDHYLIVPAATLDSETGEKKNGEVVIPVTADEIDLFNNVIGDRGNIGPATFFIPGLSQIDQKKVSGISGSPMVGGITKYRNVVKEQDIQAAKKQMEDNLLLQAKEDLKTHLEELNKANHTNLVLLDDPRFLKIELLEMRLSDDLLGSQRDKFDVFAEISVHGVAFDFDPLFKLLVQELSRRTHPDRKVKTDSLKPGSVIYEVIGEDAQAGQIKITATIQGVEQFSLDPDSASAKRFGDKVKQKILGLGLEEAESIVGNLPEVERVKIRLWPFWLKKLPLLPENISIKPMDE